jgi:O-antigen ligase
VFTYSIFCLLEGSVRTGRFGGTGRFLFGTMFDPNGLAYFFVSLFPLSLYYIIHNKGRIKQGIGFITFGTSILIIILTASRAGIVALMITIITIMLTIKLAIAKKILLILVLIVLSAMYYDRINVDRYSTISNIRGDYNITAEDGRVTIWKRGIQIILEHPITGVGAACFGEAIGTLREELDLTPKWQAAHNSYLEVASELGLIGLFVFLSLIFGCLKHFYVLYRKKDEDKLSIERQTISRLLFISAIGTLSAGFFLSQGYSIIFTMLFAFSGALRNLNSEAQV